MQGKRVVATLEDAMAFIRANTRVAQVHDLPLRMYQADELTPIWEATEKDLAAANVAPPFWAFPWAGGQALARYLIENPDAVRGKRVLDLAAGSGWSASQRRWRAQPKSQRTTSTRCAKPPWRSTPI